MRTRNDGFLLLAKFVMKFVDLVNRFNVEVWKNHRVVGHLKKGLNGKFPKLASFFLKDDLNLCTATTEQNTVNLGDGEGMQVESTLRLVGRAEFMNILRQQYEAIGEIKGMVSREKC